MSRECCIIGAAPSPAYYIDGSFCIAADAGLEKLDFLGAKPDLVIGDFDSYGKKPDIPCEILVYPTEKDDTDTMLAVKEAIKRGYDRLYLSGCTGGSPDHTMANIQALLFAKHHGATAYLVGEDQTAFVVENETVTLYPSEIGGRISIFSLGDKAEGVSLSGLKYSCNDITVTNDFPIGVSNEFSSCEAVITVKKGTLLIFFDGIPDLITIV